LISIVLWDVTTCNNVENVIPSCSVDPEDGGSACFRNVSKFLPFYTA